MSTIYRKASRLKILRNFLLLGLMILLATMAIMGQSQLGPKGSYFVSFAVDPNDAFGETIYFGHDDGGGVYKTTNGLESNTALQYIYPTTLKSRSGWTIALDPNHPSWIYVGDSYGYGVTRSTDGGLTWLVINGPTNPDGSCTASNSCLPLGPARQINSIMARNSSGSTLLYALTNKGVYQSTDLGNDWTRTSGQPYPWTDPTFTYTGLACMRAITDTCFIVGATIKPTPNPAVTTMSRSTDAGSTWSTIYTTSTGYEILTDLQVDVANGNVYAVIAGAPVSSVSPVIIRQSTNVCAATPTWNTIDTTGISTQYFAQLAAKSSQLYLATYGATYGAIRRREANGTWTDITGLIPTSSRGTLRLWIHPTKSPDTLFYSTAEHLYRTLDATATPVWTDLIPNQTPSIANNYAASVAVDPLNTNFIYVGLLQPSADGTDTPAAGLQNIYKSTDGGQTWGSLSGFSWEPNTLSINPMSEPIGQRTILAGTFSNGVVRSTDSGSTWPRENSRLTGGRVSRVLFHPRINNLAFAAVSGSSTSVPAPGIYKSTDGGLSWAITAISVPSNSTMIDFNDIIVGASNTIYVAGAMFHTNLSGNQVIDQGGIWLGSNTDSGVNWTPITVSIPPGPSIECFSVAADPAAGSSIVYCGATGTGSTGPALYKASCPSSTSCTLWTNNGGSWYGAVKSILVRARTGLPSDVFVAINTGGSAAVYLLSPSPGLYRSTDSGASWSEITSSVSPTQNYSWSMFNPSDATQIFLPIYGGSLWSVIVPYTP